MAQPSLKTRRFEEKREAILDAAARLFNEVGVKGATLADIAKSVGLVTTSVTYYYRRKELLAAACFMRTVEVFNSLAVQAARPPQVAERVRMYFRLHADRLAAEAQGKHPQLAQLNDLRALPEPQFEETSIAYTQMFRQVRKLLKGPETSLLGRTELNARTHYVLSLSHWMRTWLYPYETHDYWRLADQVSDIVLYGMASSRAEPLGRDVEVLEWQPPADPGTAPEAFLRAASELVNEQGYLGASVDRISARLNLTKGAFYHHNQNKEDLVLQCFDRTFDLIRCALQKAADKGGSGWTRTATTIQSLAHLQLSENGPLLKLGSTTALSDLSRRAGVHVTVRRLVRRLAHDILDGMVDGSIRPLDTLIAAQVTTGAINSVSELKDWVPNISPDNVSELYVRPMLYGILCRPSQASSEHPELLAPDAAVDS